VLWIFGCVCGAIMALVALGVWLVFLPAAPTRFETCQCPRCNRALHYKIKLPNKIRCSCGNIMPVPHPVPNKRSRHVVCPGCQETVHVSPVYKPTRVRCRCGNIAKIL